MTAYKLEVKYLTNAGEAQVQRFEDRSLPKVQKRAVDLIDAIGKFGHRFVSYEIVKTDDSGK